MRVVISGATSMIGVACLQACLAHDCEVLAIARQGSTRLERIPQSDRIKILYADLDALDLVQCEGMEYDVFYHFAWSHTSKGDRDNPIAQENNIRNTLRAVELAHRLGCKKFIGAGSQAEYGIVDGVIHENTRPEPTTAYGMAKLSANMLSRKLCEQYGMQHIWGRIFSVYGSNDNEGTMLNYAMDCFLNGKPARFSAATQLWNYLYEEDAGKIFYLLGEKNVACGTYCVAHTECRPLREYILQLKAVIDDTAQCEFAMPDPAVSPVSLNVDAKKTFDAIGYTPQISFSEGIRCILLSKQRNKGDDLL